MATARIGTSPAGFVVLAALTSSLGLTGACTGERASASAEAARAGEAAGSPGTSPRHRTPPDTTARICSDSATSTLPGVSIEILGPARFTPNAPPDAPSPWRVEIRYRVVVDLPLAGIVPRPQDDGNCQEAGPSGLITHQTLAGDGHRHCLCDVGLCGLGKREPRQLVPGRHEHVFRAWAVDWYGPSDYGQPRGDPFPAGTYRFSVSATGHRLGDGKEAPFRVEASCEIELADREEESAMSERAASPLTLTTSHGAVQSLASGFHTEEGDGCSVTLEAEAGWVRTSDHTWSGVGCEWRDGTRHYPADAEAASALQAALDGVEAWERAPEEAMERGVVDRSRVRVDGSDYALPPPVEEALEREARRLRDAWADREPTDPGTLFVMRVAPDGTHLRGDVEPHGVVLHRTGTSGPESLQALSAEEHVRLREHLSRLPPPSASSAAAERAYSVRFPNGAGREPPQDDAGDVLVVTHRGEPVLFFEASAPAAVREVAELVLGYGGKDRTR